MQTKDLVRASAADIRPLFERLPHGPHRLDRREVLLHQRRRIHGAMVQAVARDGYRAVSVKQVIALAGVSRRSFYEQFANKQDCFLATFDRVAGRALRSAGRAYRSADGGLEGRLAAALSRLVGAGAEDTAAAELALAAAEEAGSAGAERLRGAIATGERMLAGAYRAADGCGGLPAPIVRAVAGGLHAVLLAGLQAGELDDDVAAECTRWALSVCGRANERTWRRLAETAAARARRPCADGELAAGAEAGCARDERSRLLDSALRLSLTGEFEQLSAPQIAQEATVAIEGFHARFDDRDACYAAALEMIGDELLAAAADPGLLRGDWPSAVRRGLAAALGLLARRPVYAATIASGVFDAGPQAVAQSRGLARALACTLTAGAPAPAGAVTVDAVAGAIRHTIGCLGASGRIRIAPLLSDHLAYVVLAPYLGADEAAAAVTASAG